MKQAAEFFDLTVGSIINSILVGRRFEEHNKEEFLNIKKAMDDSMEVFSPFDMTAPVWVLKYFFRHRYDMQVNTQEKAKQFASREAAERFGRQGEVITSEFQNRED